MSGEQQTQISMGRRLRGRGGEVGALIFGLVAGIVGGQIAHTDWAPGAPAGEAAVRAELTVRLPRTPVTSVDCKTVGGLCEVISGPNVFYTDLSARYLVIGRVYDLETRTDLTASRLLELSPDTLARGSPQARTEQPRPKAVQQVDLASLPKAGAVSWGPKDGPRVIVFSDLACPYCRMLHQNLAALGARVEEYPIAILGSRPQAERVLCAQDPARALAAVYRGEPSGQGARNQPCDTRPIDANEAFFHAQGWQGTPVLIRADGQVREGALDVAGLKAWLAGGRS